MNDPFYSSFRGILRAQDHINDLYSRVKAFFDSKPYARFIELHDDGIREAHKIKLLRPIPDIVSDIVVDSAYNLRGALDQAGYAVAVLSGIPDPRKTHFPFGESAADAESRATGISKEIPQESFTFMMSFKPYKGGNDSLWALNNICNVNKHRIISAVGISLCGKGFKELNITGTSEIP